MKQAKRKQKLIKIAIVGYGYWGPNLLRNFNEMGDADVTYCCDLSEKRLDIVKNKYPSINVTTNYKEILKSDVDAIIIATPVSTHYKLARQALESGKHVWIEKPMTQKATEARKLIKLSKKKKKIIFVDHVFLYTEPVIKIKKIIDSGQLGEIYFFDSIRINLGLFQPDTNVIWDLAPHDISIMCYFLNRSPQYVSVFATSHITKGVEDTAYLSFRFKSGISAHVHVSWLSPVKIRRSIIAGSNKMILYDDLQSAESVKIYDRGISRNGAIPISSTMGYQYRTGDIMVPAIEAKEALHTAAKHFIECMQENKNPITDGEDGLKIVKILEAASKALRTKGSVKIY